jgi:hypothetical protein
MFQHLSDDPEWYSNPQNCHFIPFPFSFSEPPERFSVQDGKFEYMGREQFQGVHKTVSSLKTGGGGTRLYIQGTMGFGKSHILAALACLLYRQGKVVVFIPDVRALLLAPFPYIKLLSSAPLQAPHSKRNGSGSEPASQWTTYLPSITEFIPSPISSLTRSMR